MSCGSGDGKAFYSRMQDTATRLLNKYDCRKNIAIVRNTGEINKTEGTFEPSEGESFVVIGVTTPYQSRLINEKTIKTGDIRLVIDSAVEPNMKDKVLIDGNEYSIVNLLRYNPGGVGIGYELQLRK